jgi:hypothetical protein
MLKSAQATAISVKFVNNITMMAALWLKDVITEQKIAQNYLHKYMIIIKFAVCFSWY